MLSLFLVNVLIIPVGLIDLFIKELIKGESCIIQPWSYNHEIKLI